MFMRITWSDLSLISSQIWGMQFTFPVINPANYIKLATVVNIKEVNTPCTRSFTEMHFLHSVPHKFP